jgi:HPt (histidine-containing phosphotransfer) domain-containing protein
MESLQELFTKVAGKQINLTELDNNQIEIHTETKSLTLTKTTYPLSSIVGELTLIRISESINEQETPIDNSFISIVSDKSSDDIELLLGEDEDFLKPEEETISTKEEIIQTEENEDTISFIKQEIEEEQEAEKTEEELHEPEEELPEETEETEPIIIDTGDEHAISFLKPETDEEPEIAEAEEELPGGKLPEEELPEERAEIEPIIIDTEKISTLLGISKEEYSEFLNEFIDQSIELEPELREKNSEVQQKALSTLQKLSRILHIPVASEILEHVRESSGKTRESLIAEFYNALAKLTIHVPEVQIETPAPAEEEEISETSICNLDFSGIKPIHFDFRLEEAAEDLSLPVDLIEEFVNDFIEQGHAEKQTFIDACKSGDIKTIQKTGHKLKGAASNLRINPLADTLEEVQFCEERERFEPLLKKYWGQFLAFELFMKSKSH